MAASVASRSAFSCGIALEEEREALTAAVLQDLVGSLLFGLSVEVRQNLVEREQMRGAFRVPLHAF